jgi:hypothetical protein
MVGFNHPRIFTAAQTSEWVEVKVIGRPIFNVAVCRDQLEELNLTKAFEMDVYAVSGIVRVEMATKPVPWGLPNGYT